MVEIITPILAIFLYGIYGVSWQFIGYFVLASLLIITSFIDIEQQIIPNKIIGYGLILGILFSLTGITVGLFDAVLGFLVGAGSLFLIALISLQILGKEGMGR